MKKLLVLILALAVVFTITACGGSADSVPAAPVEEAADPSAEPTVEPAAAPTEEPEFSGYAATKTGQFKNRFSDGTMVAEYEISYDTITYSCYHAIKDGMEYLEMTAPGQAAMTSVAKGDRYYSIYHDTKTVVTAPRDVQALGSSFNAAFNIPEENEVDMADFKTGTMEVSGKLCDTEEWLVNGEPVTVCFDGDELAGVISVINGNKQVITVLSLSTEAADDALFEVPEDYTSMKLEDLFSAME